MGTTDNASMANDLVQLVVASWVTIFLGKKRWVIWNRLDVGAWVGADIHYEFSDSEICTFI